MFLWFSLTLLFYFVTDTIVKDLLLLTRVPLCIQADVVSVKLQRGYVALGTALPTVTAMEQRDRGDFCVLGPSGNTTLNATNFPMAQVVYSGEELPDVIVSKVLLGDLEEYRFIRQSWELQVAEGSVALRFGWLGLLYTDLWSSNMFSIEFHRRQQLAKQEFKLWNSFGFNAQTAPSSLQAELTNVTTQYPSTEFEEKFMKATVRFAFSLLSARLICIIIFLMCTFITWSTIFVDSYFLSLFLICVLSPFCFTSVYFLSRLP